MTTRFLKVFIVIFASVIISACAVFDTGKSTAQPGISDAESWTSESYMIGPGDILQISVWKEDDMEKDVLVKPDGGISYPLAGDVKAAGLTTSELKEVLVGKLAQYIPNAVVTVSVFRSISNKIYVVGKVARPGEFTATGYMDVLQALALAGGVTPYADSDSIKILRRSVGVRQIFQFDYDEVISGNRLDMNIILKAGDTVVVP